MQKKLILQTPLQTDLSQGLFLAQYQVISSTWDCKTHIFCLLIFTSLNILPTVKEKIYYSALGLRSWVWSNYNRKKLFPSPSGILTTRNRVLLGFSGLLKNSVSFLNFGYLGAYNVTVILQRYKPQTRSNPVSPPLGNYLGSVVGESK